MATLESPETDSANINQQNGILAGDTYSALLITPAMNRHYLCSCQKLRYDYFVGHKQWVLPNEENAGLECDAYDHHAQHIAALRQGAIEEQVVGYLRIIDRQASCGFMLEREFAPLVATGNLPLLRRPDSIELSRLVVAKELARQEVRSVLAVLFKGLYQLSLQRDYQTFLIVVEPHWLRLFARRFGFQFNPIGPVREFPDGTLAVAAYARVEDLEVALSKINPTALDWYRAS